MEYRIVERFNSKSYNWDVCKMKDLHSGDIFRMFESEAGEPAHAHTVTGEFSWEATSEPKEINGIWGIEAIRHIGVKSEYLENE